MSSIDAPEFNSLPIQVYLQARPLTSVSHSLDSDKQPIGRTQSGNFVSLASPDSFTGIFLKKLAAASISVSRGIRALRMTKK